MEPDEDFKLVFNTYDKGNSIRFELLFLKKEIIKAIEFLVSINHFTEGKENIYEFKEVFFETLPSEIDQKHVYKMILGKYKKITKVSPETRKGFIRFMDYIGQSEGIVSYIQNYIFTTEKSEYAYSARESYSKLVLLCEFLPEDENQKKKELFNFFDKHKSYITTSDIRKSIISNVNADAYINYCLWSKIKFYYLYAYPTSKIPTFLEPERLGYHSPIYKNPKCQLKYGEPVFANYLDFIFNLKRQFGIFYDYIPKILEMGGTIAGGSIVNAICNIDRKSDLDIFCIHNTKYNNIRDYIENILKSLEISFDLENIGNLSKYKNLFYKNEKYKNEPLPDIDLVFVNETNLLRFDSYYCQVSLEYSNYLYVSMNFETLCELRTRTILYPKGSFSDNVVLTHPINRTWKCLEKGFSILKWNPLYNFLFKKTNFFGDYSLKFTNVEELFSKFQNSNFCGYLDYENITISHCLDVSGDIYQHYTGNSIPVNIIAKLGEELLPIAIEIEGFCYVNYETDEYQSIELHPFLEQIKYKEIFHALKSKGFMTLSFSTDEAAYYFNKKDETMKKVVGEEYTILHKKNVRFIVTMLLSDILYKKLHFIQLIE